MGVAGDVVIVGSVNKNKYNKKCKWDTCPH